MSRPVDTPVARVVPFVLAAALALATIPGAVAATAAEVAKFRLKPGASGTRCLDCHVDFQDVVKRPHVHTPVKAGDCTGCHDPHAASHGKLLAEDKSKICATCHGSMVPKGAVSAHDAVVAGQCVSCHDPHGSGSPKSLLRSGNDLCLGCHEPVAKAIASAANKHAPVEKNCLGCHDPHAAKDAPALLSKPSPALCLDCHKPGQPGFSKAHMGYAVAKADCTSCHDAHGSSEKSILLATVHAPVKNRMCAQCHAAPAADGTAPLKKTAPDLCRGCHNALFTEIATQNRLHWPVADAKSCANCHEPHASRTPKLLTAPPKVLCGSCHPDAIARQDRSVTKHPPNNEGECGSCHAPHASNGTFLFAGSAMETCGACHDWQKHSAHPLGEKAVDMRNPNLRVECASCHRTHGTAFKHFAHADVKGDLCTQCHVQYTR